MLELLFDEPLMETGVTKNLVFDGTTPVTPVDAKTADVYFRWEDEPEMYPQYLGSTAAGTTLVVPFDIKGRAIRVYSVSRSAAGKASVNQIASAVQTVFTPGGVAVLADLVFATGTVTGTIANNGGTGTIRVLRRVGTDPFVEVTNVTPATTTFNDTPPLDATYEYELTQDGLDGTSNIRSVVVSGVSGTTGTTPTTLDGIFDTVDSIDLTWINHGGTGLNVIERKTGIFDPYTVIGTAAFGATTYHDTLSPPTHNATFYYRVSNESATGYSNEISVFVPAGFV